MSSANTIDKIFKAFSDGTRREIFHLLMLSASALTLSQIADQFQISRQGVTKHIELLKDAGLVSIKNEGRQRLCDANPQPLNEIKGWLAFYDRFWDAKLGDLSQFLDDNT